MQNDPAVSAGLGLIGLIFFITYLAVIVFTIAAYWKTFAKAGQPGWAAIIPIYNVYVLLKVAGRPGWWLLLFLVPLINIVIAILVAVDVAKAFGKGGGFAIGLVFLAPIFYGILGFGDATYGGPPTPSA